MVIALDILMVLAALVAAVPAFTFAVECFASLLDDPGGAPDLEIRPRVTVVIPAHDEADAIADTVLAVRRQLVPGDDILVVADNCRDETAENARGAGASVVVRDEPERRGKGFALSRAIEHLEADPPEVVIFMDADCRLSDGALDALADRCLRVNAPVQADFQMGAKGDDPRGVLSSLAVLVKNRVRPLGLHRMGCPVPLTGSGMAFPWPLLALAPPLGGFIVEDLLLGIEMTLQGHPPRFCPEAQVRSALAPRREAALTQRTRWEHGHLATIAAHAPRLLRAGLARRSPTLFVAALDLCVPPIALLVLVLTALLVASSLPALFGSGRGFVVAASGLTAVAFAILLAWWRHGRDKVPATYLLAAPLYVAWKLPVYARVAFGRVERRWVRTERDGEAPDGEGPA